MILFFLATIFKTTVGRVLHTVVIFEREIDYVMIPIQSVSIAYTIQITTPQLSKLRVNKYLRMDVLSKNDILLLVFIFFSVN